MWALDYNISFVCMSSLYLSQWCWLGHWCSQEVMWCLQQSSVSFVNPPAEVRGSTQGEPDRWPNNSECLSVSPGDAAAAWIVCVNPQIALSSSAHYLSVSFICFFFLDAQSSDAFRHICFRQPRVYSFVSNVVNNTVSALVSFTRQRMIKEKTASALFLSAFFCYCFYFSYGWHCIFHVYTVMPQSERWDHINVLTFSSSSFQLPELTLCNGVFKHKTVFIVSL